MIIKYEVFDRGFEAHELKESGFIFNPFDTKSRIEYVDKVITKLENQLKLLS